MKKAPLVFLLLPLLLFAPLKSHAAPEDDLAILMRHLPPDAAAFVARKGDCNHWAGEEGYDAARRREIERAIDRLKCDALDKDEAILKRRHAGDAPVLKALRLADAVYQ